MARLCIDMTMAKTEWRTSFITVYFYQQDSSVSTVEGSMKSQG